MRALNYLHAVYSSDYKTAWLIAIAADTVQLALFPFFAEGVLSPADTVVDLSVAWILTRMLGWHWAFLPTVVAELLPGFDLFPTWTAAVFYVTSLQSRVRRDRSRAVEPVILPPLTAR